jgi:heterotetrameric sarcosine oxidase gamma subunit
MIDLDGWQVPASYDGEREPSATNLSLVDLSAFAKFSLRGNGVPELVRISLGNTPAAKPLGVTTIPGNVLACRLSDDHLLVLGAAPRLELRLADIDLNISALSADCQAPRAGVVIVNAASTYAGFALIGGPIEEILRRLTAIDVSEKAFPVGSCVQTSFAGMTALLVRAQELRVPCVRVYVASDLAEYVWEKLLQAGRQWSIAPVGQERSRALLNEGLQ